MPRSTKGHTYILVISDEIPNYLSCTPIHFARSLQENTITKIWLSRCNDHGSRQYIYVLPCELFFQKVYNKIKQVGGHPTNFY